MTTLGIFQTPAQREQGESDEHSLRAEIAKRVALGGGWSVGAAVVLGAYEILRSNPKDAFPLLQAWGPRAIGCLIALYFGYDLIKAALSVGDRLASAVERVAVAQQRSADKDDRQIQEIQTLASFSAQESERTSAKMTELTELVKDSIGKSERRHRQLTSIEEKLDMVLEPGGRKL